MAHWKNTAVTDSGVEMLNEWMAGRKITVTSAWGGSGTVDPEQLTEQTGHTEGRHQLRLMGQENKKDGVTIQVQVNNVGLDEEYELNWVEIYAALDKDRNPDAEERLLFIMQDENGVTVPTEDDEIFLLELYAAIGITNKGRFVVTVDYTGLVTIGKLNEAIKAAIDEHNADGDAHGGAVGGGGASIVKLQITIPKDGWLANLDPDELPGLMHVDIPVENVTEDIIPSVLLAPASRETAKLCGFDNSPRTLNGIVRVFARNVPTEDMYATLVLEGEGGVLPTGGGVLPIASKTVLGGLKIGDGLNMAKDGTASVDWSKISPEAVTTVAEKIAESDTATSAIVSGLTASDEEANSVLNDALN